MNSVVKKILLGMLLFNIANVQAQTDTNIQAVVQPINVKTEKTVANMDTVLKDSFVKSKFSSAENRFLQGNVKASYDDFSELIKRTAHDDYVFLIYGIKMAEYGFFDLSDELIGKLDRNHFTAAYVNDMKRFYWPSTMTDLNDTIYLSDAYSNIVYNNMSLETTSELLNSIQAAQSDYKNYLIALGCYKSNNLTKALKFVNNAIKENDRNVNYLCLKARILADSDKSSQALNIVEQIKREPFLTTDFQNKVLAIEEYVLYKNAKSKILKDYHLAYYYHLQNKSQLAVKVLQSAALSSKKYSNLIYSLLGRIYFENDELAKSEECAVKAYKEDKRNYLSVLTLADLSFEKRNFEDALMYYKKAGKLTKSSIPQVGIAKSYLALQQADKSKKMYEKMLKKEKFNEELLVESLKIIPHRVDYYLPRAVSIDISNNDIWLGLANQAIKDGNYKMATTYLNNSYYIDENDFRYYYYLSLVLRAKGDIELANQSLLRCSNINADYAAVINPGNYVYEK